MRENITWRSNIKQRQKNTSAFGLGMTAQVEYGQDKNQIQYIGGMRFAKHLFVSLDFCNLELQDIITQPGTKLAAKSHVSIGLLRITCPKAMSLFPHSFK